jgi:hypothetical protein
VIPLRRRTPLTTCYCLPFADAFNSDRQTRLSRDKVSFRRVFHQVWNVADEGTIVAPAKGKHDREVNTYQSALRTAAAHTYFAPTGSSTTAGSSIVSATTRVGQTSTHWPSISHLFR